ncbi:MAG: SAM-dependent methyltransferase [Calditrichaeota bacterium]|nr:MAG: SAM-dependent methyltransferase [Calditrichota bacterium]
MKPTLYLIPAPLGESKYTTIFPSYNLDVINQIEHFIVENARTARRFLSKLGIDKKLTELHFYELNKHTQPEQIAGFLAPLQQGHDLGLLSEAGTPAVADPGAEVVQRVHRIGFAIVPLVGPSSILLALMASGLNGQSFAFNGYLPIEKNERRQRINFYEKRSRQERQTQLFIETPYRNTLLFTDLLQNCNGNTRLCVATDLTMDSQRIQTFTIAEWQQKQKPEMHKRPTIFLFLAQ